ncbi:hypothetical protein PRUPE_2G138700 [Prunus persica]|uniref:Uncharacterized protein n=1 Tax=Prunus persica TaxID=3760 RepID=A0A251QFS4_PRUPE|nr:hypothetical protein PRUPE_2G138700 [Prunus persica]
MFQVIGVVFVSAAARVVTLDCVFPWEGCDIWWLMFCLCFNGGGSSDAGGCCWDVILFFTLRRSKNYTWSYEVFFVRFRIEVENFSWVFLLLFMCSSSVFSLGFCYGMTYSLYECQRTMILLIEGFF